jgi:hypothetical protein
MKPDNSNIIILAIVAATASLVLFSHGAAASYAQTNATDNSTSAPMAPNATASSASASQSSPSGNPALTSIDAGISAIKSGDSEGAKKNLYKAEVALENNPNAAGAEKHVEAALKALKDGDTKGATFHAEEAKKGLA